MLQLLPCISGTKVVKQGFISFQKKSIENNYDILHSHLLLFHSFFPITILHPVCFTFCFWHTQEGSFSLFGHFWLQHLPSFNLSYTIFIFLGSSFILLWLHVLFPISYCTIFCFFVFFFFNTLAMPFFLFVVEYQKLNQASISHVHFGSNLQWVKLIGSNIRKFHFACKTESERWILLDSSLTPILLIVFMQLVDLRPNTQNHRIIFFSLIVWHVETPKCGNKLFKSTSGFQSQYWKQ